MKKKPNLTRRRMLRAGLLTAGSITAADAEEKLQPLSNPPWSIRPGADCSRYGARSEFEDGVLRLLDPTQSIPSSSWSFSPIQDLFGITTPNALFYERHHGGIPAIDPREHQLLIHGAVDRPLLLTVEDLKRFPAVSRFHFLECSGNSDYNWRSPDTKSVQHTHGLLSCAEWTGVPLSTLLKEAGYKDGNPWVLAEGADGVSHTRSIPIEIAMDDALVAYGMNGEALRPSNGYPIRLFLPGREGNMNVKYLRRLKVGPEPWFSKDETSRYTDLLPNGLARQFTYMMETKSVITSPSAGHGLDGKGNYEIRGLAWSGYGKIAAVHVTTDGGLNWTKATLDEPVLPKCLTSFRLPWTWKGGEQLLMSQAVDDCGYVQPTRDELTKKRGLWSEYHNNSIQPWLLEAGGSVKNVQVTPKKTPA